MKKGNKVIYVLVLLLVLVIAGFSYYCLTLNQKLKDVKSSDERLEEREVEKEEQPEEEKIIEYTLFNEEKTLEEICTNKAGICEKSLGNFNLGEREYSFSIHYNMDDLFNTNRRDAEFNNEQRDTNLDNYISIGNKKIDIYDVNESLYKLDKIVKISTDYIAIGIDSMAGGNYMIHIYDEDLNLVKAYTSIHIDTDNFSEYFTVSNKSFTRYACNTTGENQVLEKYQVTLNGNRFEEQLISSTPTFCSAQT